MMAKTKCGCCCPCAFAIDDWSGHLTTDFIYTDPLSTVTTSWTAISGDGTTLGQRTPGAATINIVGNDVPSVELDVVVTFAASGGLQRPSVMMGQIFPSLALTPTGSAPGYQATMDGSYRFLRSVNHAGTITLIGDASVPTGYFGTPTINCALAMQQGSKFYTTGTWLSSSSFFGAGGQFEGITGTNYTGGAGPAGAVCGTWGRSATKTVAGCESSYVLSLASEIVTPCALNAASHPSFALGAATVYFGYCFIIDVGSLGNSGTIHYTVRFDRLCINLV